MAWNMHLKVNQLMLNKTRQLLVNTMHLIGTNSNNNSLKTILTNHP